MRPPHPQGSSREWRVESGKETDEVFSVYFLLSPIDSLFLAAERPKTEGAGVEPARHLRTRPASNRFPSPLGWPFPVFSVYFPLSRIYFLYMAVAAIYPDQDSNPECPVRSGE